MSASSNIWRTVPIKEICHGIYDGPHATPKPSDMGPVFLGIKNITENGRIDLSDIRHISDNDFPTWTRRVTPQKDDIVFSYEATLNRYSLIPDGFRGCLGRRLALIRPDTTKVLPRFLLYYFFGREWRGIVSKNILSGSTVDRIPLTEFPNFEVQVPNLCVQNKIASVLYSYDGLIDNNMKRIDLLIEMGQMLFREWFIKYKFPGSENVGMYDSQIGMIPHGWSVRQMSEVAQVIDCLHSKKPEEDNNGEGILLQLFNIAENGIIDLSRKFLISKEDYNLWISRIEVLCGDCVITNVGRIAAVAQIPQGVRAAIGRNMTAIRPIEGKLTPTFLIEYLLSPLMRKEVDKKKDSGTIMDSLNVRGINVLNIPVPPFELMKKFESIARPIRRQIEVLVKQNHTLNNTRNILLPKLISGELDVENLDIDIGGDDN